MKEVDTFSTPCPTCVNWYAGFDIDGSPIFGCELHNEMFCSKWGCYLYELDKGGMYL